MGIIINLLINAVTAFFLSKYILPGVHIDSFTTAVLFAIVLALLNLIIRPVLSILGLPLTVITLGLFSLVINAIILLLADHFVDGLVIDGFWWALVFSIALSAISSLLSGIFRN